MAPILFLYFIFNYTHTHTQSGGNEAPAHSATTLELLFRNNLRRNVRGTLVNSPTERLISYIISILKTRIFNYLLSFWTVNNPFFSAGLATGLNQRQERDKFCIMWPNPIEPYSYFNVVNVVKSLHNEADFEVVHRKPKATMHLLS